ncbi:MAG: hypothetical protein ACXAC8_20095 [Candidatus Hodarchaeales archaeon]|jgi:hypothetical protein
MEKIRCPVCKNRIYYSTFGTEVCRKCEGYNEISEEEYFFGWNSAIRGQMNKIWQIIQNLDVKCGRGTGLIYLLVKRENYAEKVILNPYDSFEFAEQWLGISLTLILLRKNFTYQGLQPGNIKTASEKPELKLLEDMKKSEVLEKFLTKEDLRPSSKKIEELYDEINLVFTAEDPQDKSLHLLEVVKSFFQIFSIFNYPDFSDLFEAFHKFERILYALLPKYRDHLMHSVRIFIFSIYIVYSISGTDRIRYADDSLKINPNTLYCLFILSILHDIGYPIEMFDLINKKIEELLGKYPQLLIIPAQLQLYDQIRLLVPRYIDEMILHGTYEKINLSEEELEFICMRAWERREHGMIGALFLLHFCRKHTLLTFREGPVYGPPYLSNWMYRVASAIAWHNENFKLGEDEIKRNVSIIYEESPLLFLLRLLDELHEWEREQFQFPEYKMDSSYSLNNFEMKPIGVRYLLTFNLSYKGEIEALEKEISKKEWLFSKLYSSHLGIDIVIYCDYSEKEPKKIQIGWIKLKTIVERELEKGKAHLIDIDEFTKLIVSKYPSIKKDLLEDFLKKFYHSKKTIKNGKTYLKIEYN